MVLLSRFQKRQGLRAVSSVFHQNCQVLLSDRRVTRDRHSLSNTKRSDPRIIGLAGTAVKLVTWINDLPTVMYRKAIET